MQWIYDLQGLDLVAWARRAHADLAAHQAAADAVPLVVGNAEASEVATLRAVLAAAGYPTRPLLLLGIAALALGETDDPDTESEARTRESAANGGHAVREP